MTNNTKTCIREKVTEIQKNDFEHLLAFRAY